MTKMRMLMLTIVAVAGLGFATAPSMADYGRHYGGYHRFDDCRYQRPVYHRHVPVARRYAPYWPGHRPLVIQPAPGIYYSGRNLSFGIGF